MRIRYHSGGGTSFYYEANMPKILVEAMVFRIEKLVPAIRFEGHRLYPKRIYQYKIFATETLSEENPDSIRSEYPDGYDFDGDDVTLQFVMRPSTAPTPEYKCGECGASVNTSDEKCPNGHILFDVGKRIDLTLTEGITLSNALSTSTGFVIDKIENIAKELDLPSLNPKDQAKLDTMLMLVKVLEENDAEQTTILSLIKDQTSPPTLRQRIQENLLDYIITLAIGLVLGLLF